MGHSEMLLAVAGLKGDEIKTRTRELASGDWSGFAPAERQAFHFAHKLSSKPASLTDKEVKALAAQTSKATNEIATQIAGMQSATNEAVGAIREITDTIGKISEISGAIAAAVEQQDATTKEISRNVMEAAKGTAEVACNITEVNKGAAETGSASTQVLSSAKQLAGDSGTLRREVDSFLATVRAA